MSASQDANYGAKMHCSQLIPQQAVEEDFASLTCQSGLWEMSPNFLFDLIETWDWF